MVAERYFSMQRQSALGSQGTKKTLEDFDVIAELQNSSINDDDAFARNRRPARTDSQKIEGAERSQQARRGTVVSNLNNRRGTISSLTEAGHSITHEAASIKSVRQVPVKSLAVL